MVQPEFKSCKQEVLLTTVHNLENVVEIYLNDDKKVVTELLHLSNHRMKVYQYSLDEYKNRPGVYDLFEKF